MGGRPRSTSASCGGSSSCLSRLTACCRESLTITSKSFPSAYDRVSVVGGSSKKISRLGLAFSGMGFDAFQEGAFQRRFLVLQKQVPRRPGVGEPAAVQDGDLIADLFDVGERVRRQQYGPALGFHPEQQRLGASARLGIEAAHRLVENVQVALREETRGEAELLGHALGVVAHGLVE